MNNLESKLDKVVESVSDLKTSVARIEVHVEKNTEDLAEHMRRTALAENRITSLEVKRYKMDGVGIVVMGILTLLIIPIALHFIKTHFN